MSPAGPSQLEAMVRYNAGEEFGGEIAESLAALPISRVVLVDGRMLPHEWLALPSGQLLKTDGAEHGDDHFFPGPADIAWDLAGAIIEWEMTRDAAHHLIEHYRRRSGDDPRSRLDAYLLAYAVFRMAYCAMAGFALRGNPEEARFQRAWRHYRALAEAQFRARPGEGRRAMPAPPLTARDEAPSESLPS